MKRTTISSNQLIKKKGKTIERSWSDLPLDLLFLIASLLDLIDFLAFRGVCSSWRSAATKEDFDKTRQFPYLMASSRINGKFMTHLLNPRTGQIYPSTRIPSESYSLGLKGWILVVNPQNGEMCLLHVFSRHQNRLPNRDTLKCRKLVPFDKTALSSDPLTTTDIRLLIIYDERKRIAFWSSGNSSFHPIDAPYPVMRYWDAIFYKGSAYSIEDRRFISKYNLTGRRPPICERIGQLPLVLLPLVRDRPISVRSYYFVETFGDFMIVALDTKDKFTVLQFWADKFFAKRTDIRDRALFVGEGCSALSVDVSKIPGCKANHIYFVDSVRAVVSSMNIKDLKVERHWEWRVKLEDCYNPPFWVEPTFF